MTASKEYTRPSYAGACADLHTTIRTGNTSADAQEVSSQDLLAFAADTREAFNAAQFAVLDAMQDGAAPYPEDGRPAPDAGMPESDICYRLTRATVGACTCMTKTPDVRYHDAQCLYRVLCDARAEIVALRERAARWDARS